MANGHCAGGPNIFRGHASRPTTAAHSVGLRSRATKERNSRLSLAFDWGVEHSPDLHHFQYEMAKWRHYAAKNVRARESARLVDSRPRATRGCVNLGNKAGLAKGHQSAADSHGGWLWLLVSRLVVFSGVIFLALLRAMNLCAMRPSGRSGIFFCEMAVGLWFFSTALTQILL